MLDFSKKKRLSQKFYQRDSVIVAQELLGKVFVRKLNNQLFYLKITETEAYRGKDDQASHTFNGKTPRNSVMFLPGGHLYVYFTYGKHFCANVVTGPENQGDAVLLRGMEPLNNLEILSQNRFSKSELTNKEKINLTNGPAKICQALNIKRNENGINLLQDEIFIVENIKPDKEDIVTTTRIGIKKSADLPWRFYLKDNPWVSVKV